MGERIREYACWFRLVLSRPFSTLYGHVWCLFAGKVPVTPLGNLSRLAACYFWILLVWILMRHQQHYAEHSHIVRARIRRALLPTDGFSDKTFYSARRASLMHIYACYVLNGKLEMHMHTDDWQRCSEREHKSTYSFYRSSHLYGRGFYYILGFIATITIVIRRKEQKRHSIVSYPCPMCESPMQMLMATKAHTHTRPRCTCPYVERQYRWYGKCKFRELLPMQM